MEYIYWIIFAIPSIIVASTIHEYAHAWASTKLGDYTAKTEGRLSLNPLVHIDPIGALCMVIARFGWSKPVPINEYNFKNPVLGTAMVAAAGPISNLILTIFATIAYRLTQTFVEIPLIIDLFIQTFIIVNLSLMIFNLIPLPPLDGHRIVRALLPQAVRYYWEMLEKYSIWIMLLLFIPFSPLSKITSSLISGTLDFFIKILINK